LFFCFGARSGANQNNFSNNTARCIVLNVTGCFLMMIMTLNIVCYKDMYNSVNNNNIIQPIGSVFLFGTRSRTNQNNFSTNIQYCLLYSNKCDGLFLMMIMNLKHCMIQQYVLCLRTYGLKTLRKMKKVYLVREILC
jgi:hypothetical protein